jgi:hypothetical protein
MPYMYNLVTKTSATPPPIEGGREGAVTGRRGQRGPRLPAQGGGGRTFTASKRAHPEEVAAVEAGLHCIEAVVYRLMEADPRLALQRYRPRLRKAALIVSDGFTPQRLGRAWVRLKAFHDAGVLPIAGFARDRSTALPAPPTIEVCEAAYAQLVRLLHREAEPEAKAAARKAALVAVLTAPAALGEVDAPCGLPIAPPEVLPVSRPRLSSQAVSGTVQALIALDGRLRDSAQLGRLVLLVHTLRPDAGQRALERLIGPMAARGFDLPPSQPLSPGAAVVIPTRAQCDDAFTALFAASADGPPSAARERSRRDRFARLLRGSITDGTHEGDTHA